MYIDKYWGNYIGDTDDSLNLIVYLKDQQINKANPTFTKVSYDLGLDKLDGDFTKTTSPLEYTLTDGLVIDFHFAINIIVDFAALLLESRTDGCLRLYDFDSSVDPDRIIIVRASEESDCLISTVLQQFIADPLAFDLSELVPDKDMWEMAKICQQLWDDLYCEGLGNAQLVEMSLEEKLDYWHQKNEFQKIIDSLEAIPAKDRGYKLTGLLARAYSNSASIGKYEPLEKALDLLQSTADEGGKDPDWHFRMGYALYYLDRDAEAIPYFENIFKLVPPDPQTQAFWADAKFLLDSARRRVAQNAAPEESDEYTIPGYDPSQTADDSKVGAFDRSLLLVDMFNDEYFPDFLVEKIKGLLEEVVDYLESGEHSYAEIQAKLDEAIEAINDLEKEFDENDSEIETVARESIGESVWLILQHYKIEIDIEQALRQREW